MAELNPLQFLQDASSRFRADEQQSNALSKLAQSGDIQRLLGAQQGDIKTRLANQQGRIDASNKLLEDQIVNQVGSQLTGLPQTSGNALETLRNINLLGTVGKAGSDLGFGLKPSAAQGLPGEVPQTIEQLGRGGFVFGDSPATQANIERTTGEEGTTKGFNTVVDPKTGKTSIVETTQKRTDKLKEKGGDELKAPPQSPTQMSAL